jgi:tetratricopeptide (TPR) repeat protein
VNSFKARYNLGALLGRQQRLEEAAEHLIAALQIRPEYPQALNALGLVRSKQHQPQLAAELIRKALHLQPDYAPAMLNLGNVLSELGQMSEAEHWIHEALRVRPRYAEAWHDLGAFCERQKQSADALAAYQQAAQLQPESTHYLAALENARRHVCDWSARPASLDRLLEIVRQCARAVRRGSPDPDETSDRRSSSPNIQRRHYPQARPCPLWPAASIRFPTTNEDRLAIARDYAAPIAARVGGPVGKIDPATWRSVHDRRIRLGFLPHEFGDHILSYAYPRVGRILARTLSAALIAGGVGVLTWAIAALIRGDELRAMA